MNEFPPKLDILPAPQRTLWGELGAIPADFVLYGGTAIALRLGHRGSVDFDFFSSRAHPPAELQRQVAFAGASQTLQTTANTLTISVDRSGPVKVSFFWGLTIGRVGVPETAGRSGVRVASLLDLTGTKLKVIQERAEKRDYLDLAALLSAGVSLAEGLAAAQTLYGVSFNPAISLKALTYFRDGDLPALNAQTQQQLIAQASQVRDLPSIPLRSPNLDA